jgi:hypothetical protein
MSKTIVFFLFIGHFTFAQTPVLDNNIKQIAVEFQADYGSLSRFYIIQNSPERRERFQAFYKSYQSKLSDLDFNSLSQSDKVDYILINRHITNKIYRLSVEKNEYEQLKQWAKPGEPVYALEQKRRRGIQLDGQLVAKTINNISKEIEGVLKLIKTDSIMFSKPLAHRASEIILGQKKALGSVFVFYKGYDPQFSWWVSKPFEKADSLFSDYASVLKRQIDYSSMPEDDGSGIVGNPIGEAEVIRQLKHQMIPYGPEKLVEIANKEFAWCDKELLKASSEMGFGDDWRAAQEKVKQSFVLPGKQPEAMLQLYNESVDFLKENDLLTIPLLSEETWRVSMIKPKNQLISPFFLGGELLQISYPTDDMQHEDKLMSMRGNNPHFSRATVHHELIAGHHLQQYMNRRNNTHRFYGTPFWTEGWALYWELLLWDLEFPKSPEDKIGMLFWRMHRCARIIFSLNYHMGKWTPQQCIDFLVERVGHERANAEGEVRRSFTGNYGPLYQIAYMIGELQFRALKEELVDSGKMTYKEYHDAVLRENSMPVEMVRALLTNQSIKKNFKTNWKFYE